MSSSANVFEQVRKGAITPSQGADLLAKQRRDQRRPSKPTWLPTPLYLLGMVFLMLLLPRFVGRSS